MQGLCTCEAHELGLSTSPAALESAKLINNCANNECSCTLQNITDISKNNINKKRRDVSSLEVQLHFFFFAYIPWFDQIVQKQNGTNFFFLMKLFTINKQMWKFIGLSKK